MPDMPKTRLLKSEATALAVAIGAAAVMLAGIVNAQATRQSASAPAPAARPAASVQPFTQAAFAAAQAAGGPVLVEVHAPWCPTCRAQGPQVEAALRNQVLPGLTVFRLDFDSQRAERRALRVNRQSTLIMYRGARETGRNIGVTDPAAIATLIRSAAAPAQAR